MSQVPQKLVGTLRHVDTVESHMVSAFLYDNTALLSSTKLSRVPRQDETWTLIIALT